MAKSLAWVLAAYREEGFLWERWLKAACILWFQGFSMPAAGEGAGGLGERLEVGQPHGIALLKG
jgi:hypothetical protein